MNGHSFLALQYLPTEFGSHFTDLLGDYKGYNTTADPSTLISFASAAFRYAHAAINEYPGIDECGTMKTYGYPGSMPAPTSPAPPCQSAYPNISAVGQGGPMIQINIPVAPGGGPFNKIGWTMPAGLVASAGGFESIARGLVATRTAPISLGISSAIRNIFTTAVDGAGILDLLALDILRGRHNQVPSYATLRKVYSTGPFPDLYTAPGCASASSGPDPLACFLAITGSGTPELTVLAAKLQDLYKKVTSIDPLIGMLAEVHAPGSSVGCTMGAIIMAQYKKTRDSDRFFYLNSLGSFTKAEAKEILKATMGGILNANLRIPGPGERGSLDDDDAWQDKDEEGPGKYFPKNPFIVPRDYHRKLTEAHGCQGVPNLYNGLDAASCAA